MPIPTDGPWPPPPYQPAYNAYRDWDAWFAGDPDRLRDVYRLRGARLERQPPSSRTRPSQYAGGIVGRFSRWLWGNPPPPNTRDARLHVPVPADLAATSANLLFSEPPQLSIEQAAAEDADTPARQPDRNAAEARLERLVEDGLATLLLHAAEADSAFGDVYLRPVIDRDVYPDRAFLTAVHADGALPHIRWGQLLEVTFWSVAATEGQSVWRLLEHHEPGQITYALHRGGPMILGRRVGLDERPELEHLVDAVDDDGTQSTGIEALDVVRIPNCGPQRMWRTDPILKYLGRSDFDGNEQLFDQIDETWTSWMRDVRLAKARISVPAVMMQDAGPGAGATWDPDREIYSQLNALPKDMSGDGLTLSQFKIRHIEHKATIDALMEVALRHAGLSSQTLGDQPDGAPVTATEVQQRERQSFITRGNRIQAWRPGLARAVELLMAVEQAAQLSRVEPVAPHVEFGDSVSESPEALARTVELLNRAEAISYETRVRMVHPDWAKEEVDDEVARLRDVFDAPAPVDPAAAFGALAGQGQGPGQPPPEE